MQSGAHMGAIVANSWVQREVESTPQQVAVAITIRYLQ